MRERYDRAYGQRWRQRGLTPDEMGFGALDRPGDGGQLEVLR